MKPTKKASITKIRKRAQPPDLLSSEDESGLNLSDLMDALGTVTTHWIAAQEKLATASRSTPKAPPLPAQATRFALPPHSEEIQPRGTHPSADFGGLLDIEEQVRARLIERIRGISTSYFPTTNEESGQDEPPQVPRRRQRKGGSGRHYSESQGHMAPQSHIFNVSLASHL